MSIAEWRQKQIPELKQVLSDLLRKQFKLNLTKASGELTKNHQVKQIRRDIARVSMLLGEKSKGKE